MKRSSLVRAYAYRDLLGIECVKVGCGDECATKQGHWLNEEWPCCPWYAINQDIELLYALNMEALMSEGLVQYDARDYAAWLTLLIRDIRNRKAQRELQQLQSAAKKKEKRGKE